MTVCVLFRVNFHSELEFCGVFYTDESAREYAARFPGETFDYQSHEIDNP